MSPRPPKGMKRKKRLKDDGYLLEDLMEDGVLSNSISLPDVRSAVRDLEDLLDAVGDNPMHRLARYLHKEFCRDMDCDQEGIECASGISWVKTSANLLEEISSIFPGEEQKQEKPAKRSRKLQLEEEK